MFEVMALLTTLLVTCLKPLREHIMLHGNTGMLQPCHIAACLVIAQRLDIPIVGATIATGPATPGADAIGC